MKNINYYDFKEKFSPFIWETCILPNLSDAIDNAEYDADEKAWCNKKTLDFTIYDGDKKDSVTQLTIIVRYDETTDPCLFYNDVLTLTLDNNEYFNTPE